MYRNERRKNKSQIKTAWIENGIVDAVVYESLLPLNDFTDDLQRLHRHSMWQFLRLLKFYLIRLISNALYTIIWLVNQNSGKCKCRYYKLPLISVILHFTYQFGILKATAPRIFSVGYIFEYVSWVQSLTLPLEFAIHTHTQYNLYLYTHICEIHRKLAAFRVLVFSLFTLDWW